MVEGLIFKYRTDGEAYRDSNSGCQAATEFLGYQSSSCLKCPFRKCVYDEPIVGVIRAKNRKRNEEIRQRFKGGEDTQSLARAFDVSSRTIQRIVRHHG